MLRNLRRLTEEAYVAAFGGRRGQRINDAVLRMALHARGYGEVGSLATTGELAFIERLAGEPVGLCIDVGANRGDYARALLERTTATVLAFEPHPQTFQGLAALRDRYPQRLLAVPRGVAQSEGSLELRYGANSELASFSAEVLAIDYVGQCNVRSCSVAVTSIDRYLEVEARQLAGLELTLIKIDAEGFEYEVLAGAQQTLRQRRPKFVQMEFNQHQLHRGHTLLELSRLLPGYAVRQILPRERGLRRLEPDDPLSNFFQYANFLFCRSDLGW